VYVLVLTQGNTNAAAAFRFMRQARAGCPSLSPPPHPPPRQQVITLFKSYFGSFDEDSLKNNFVLIYELLDGPLTWREC
jgi:AP-2 complex subunit mu-1